MTSETAACAHLQTDGRCDCAFSRRHLRPSLAFRCPSSVEGAGKVGWPLAPGAPAQKDCARARRPQVQADTLRPSLREWFTAYSALSSVNQLVATVVSAMRETHCRKLDACIGAPGPRDFAVRQERRSSVGLFPSIATRLACRDDRETPLRKPRRDGAKVSSNSEKTK